MSALTPPGSGQQSEDEIFLMGGFTKATRYDTNHSQVRTLKRYLVLSTALSSILLIYLIASTRNIIHLVVKNDQQGYQEMKSSLPVPDSGLNHPTCSSNPVSQTYAYILISSPYFGEIRGRRQLYGYPN